jgi:hypothetical protein
MHNAQELNTSRQERLQPGFGTENKTRGISRDSAYHSYPPNVDPVLDTPTSGYPVPSDPTSTNFLETPLAGTITPLYGADYGSSRHPIIRHSTLKGNMKVYLAHGYVQTLSPSIFMMELIIPGSRWHRKSTYENFLQSTGLELNVAGILKRITLR